VFPVRTGQVPSRQDRVGAEQDLDEQRDACQGRDGEGDE